jgi:MtrB/PioB family decaheme-associated outer membrane protein
MTEAGMKTTFAIWVALCASPVAAQAPVQPATPTPPSTLEVSGSITPGVEGVDNSTDSSKLTEYRDLKNQFYLPRVTFSAANRQSGWTFAFSGTNVSRDDQTIVAEGGRLGAWSLSAVWIGVPHNFSNKALTPYINRAPGLLELGDTVPITFKKLATSAPDTASVLASDELIATYQSTFLAPAPLETQTNDGRFSANWLASETIRVGIAYDRLEKTGQKSAFGPIGDRPPRTLNIQLAEPVDYRTNDLTFSVAHEGDGYQVQAEYLFSDFENRIDTLQWQNAYTTAAPGADFDVWDRLVATSGVRALPPDNRYHNATVNGAVDLSRESRVMGSLSYGRLEQNATLLPYAYQADAIANPTLPRSSAEGLINTYNVTADVVTTPLARLNVRGYFRSYVLDNDTPSSQWQYVTSDTTNLNGTVAYVNKRVSVPYAWSRQDLGAEATWRLARRNTISVEYQREAFTREHREADTTEHIIRATWRGRPTSWFSLRGRYILGLRNGSDYNNEVTHEGYWYAPNEATDANNPALTFDNHPDMRRYDVSDRQRQQFDLTASVTSADMVAVSAYIRSRRDDFDSDVTPSQPLLGTGLPEQAAVSPGDQLGKLEDNRLRYGADVFVQLNPRVTVNAFLNYDKGSSLERSLEFNENNKQNPSAVATAELGPWTRASSQWTADIDDRTWSGGLGATFQVVPERVTLAADYTVSLADVEIAYSGYGVTNFNGTPFPPNHQFAFSSPPTVEENLHVINLRCEIPIKTIVLVAGYSYEQYDLNDWQQGSQAPWVEPVASDTLLRDTSRSYQWGNRLFNFGTYLAPGYHANIGFIGFRYRF